MRFHLYGPSRFVFVRLSHEWVPGTIVQLQPTGDGHHKYLVQMDRDGREVRLWFHEVDMKPRE